MNDANNNNNYYYEMNILQVSWKQTMLTSHMLATSTISAIRLWIVLICDSGGQDSSGWFGQTSGDKHHRIFYVLILADVFIKNSLRGECRYMSFMSLFCWALVWADLVKDGGVCWQHSVVLDESDPDPPGGSQLLGSTLERVALQLKVSLSGRAHSTLWELQLPAGRVW